jgi:hypothetical protein
MNFTSLLDLADSIDLKREHLFPLLRSFAPLIDPLVEHVFSHPSPAITQAVNTLPTQAKAAIPTKPAA